MAYYPVCHVDELPEGARKIVEIDGISIMICHLDGAVYAFENRCSHEDLPLVDGHIENKEIICPFHGAKFCLKTGNPTLAPAFESIQTFELIEQDNKLFVCL